MSAFGAANKVAEPLWNEVEKLYASLTESESGQGEKLASRAPMPFSEEAKQRLQEAFGLSRFEEALLMLCAESAVRRDSSEPTFRLALDILEDANPSVLSLARPLRFWGLIEKGTGQLLDAPLRVDERVLQFLLGIPTLDARLDGAFHPMGAVADGPSVDLTKELSADQCVSHWRRPDRQLTLLCLVGGSSLERESLFRIACRKAGLLPWRMVAANLPHDAADRMRLARLWSRESVLAPAALLVHAGTAEEMRRVEAWLEQVDAPVTIETATDLAPSTRAVCIHLPQLTNGGRDKLWRLQLGVFAEEAGDALGKVIDTFPLGEEQIRLAAEIVQERMTAGEPASGALWKTCRELARTSLDQLARRMESKAEWTDLILPSPQMEVLQQIAVHAREAATVHGEWGFGDRYGLGLGLTALFAGASGTGKTMAAGILARELDRDLYQIDLSTLVSKYIGETEEHLRRVFDAAEQSGAILLFDEADALFGKRTQVKDSHDRYANLEVSYLLQRMESYRGVALLTTNMQHALDPAFVRRLRFVVQFPFPGPEERCRIWQRIFPKEAPVDALDYPRLAQLNLPGGVIRNVAFHAAFLAAGEQGRIGMNHILRATRTEYGKMEKPMSASELRGWI
jgi:hypothetical protein